jgi:hypothetical protein
MNGDIDKPDDAQEIEEDSVDSSDHTATVVMEDVDEDLVLESTAEVKVDELVAKLDKTDAEEAAEKAAIRKRLEEAREKQDANLDGTYNFNLDDDL